MRIFGYGVLFMLALMFVGMLMDAPAAVMTSIAGLMMLLMCSAAWVIVTTVWILGRVLFTWVSTHRG